MTCPLPPGQSQCLHAMNLELARWLIALQAEWIADLERRLRGEPMRPLDPLAAVQRGTAGSRTGTADSTA